MNVDKYLNRIEFEGVREPTLETLNKLHNQHYLNVPFENLDIHYDNYINLDLETIYNKIIDKKRGGYCYELNGLFCSLLLRLGFKAKMVSARVYNSENDSFSPEFDHMAIVVEIDGKEFLADVGFGDFIFESIPMELDLIHDDKNGKYIIEKHSETHLKVSKLKSKDKNIEYIFSKTERQFNEFSNRSNFHQRNSESHFQKKKIITRPTADGRITLSGDSLKITSDGETVIKKKVENGSDFRIYLLEYFYIKEEELHTHTL